MKKILALFALLGNASVDAHYVRHAYKAARTVYHGTRPLKPQHFPKDLSTGVTTKMQAPKVHYVTKPHEPTLLLYPDLLTQSAHVLNTLCIAATGLLSYSLYNRNAEDNDLERYFIEHIG